MDGELQSKDLECVHARVVVEADGSLSVTQERESDLDYRALAQDIVVTGECRRCSALYVCISRPGYFTTGYPLIEATLQFRGGLLVNACRTGTPSIEETKQWNLERGRRACSWTCHLDEGPAPPTQRIAGPMEFRESDELKYELAHWPEEHELLCTPSLWACSSCRVCEFTCSCREPDGYQHQCARKTD